MNQTNDHSYKRSSLYHYSKTLVYGSWTQHYNFAMLLCLLFLFGCLSRWSYSCAGHEFNVLCTKAMRLVLDGIATNRSIPNKKGSPLPMVCLWWIKLMTTGIRGFPSTTTVRYCSILLEHNVITLKCCYVYCSSLDVCPGALTHVLGTNSMCCVHKWWGWCWMELPQTVQ